jgi:hypothetical protein
MITQRPARADQTYDLTVRVGCSLVYESTGPASLLINVQPQPNRDHAVVFEALTFGQDLPVEWFVDSPGNHVVRVPLARGTNCFRHDAIVAVTSRPDNPGLVGGVPQEPGDLPPAVERSAIPVPKGPVETW